MENQIPEEFQDFSRIFPGIPPEFGFPWQSSSDQFAILRLIIMGGGGWCFFK